MAQKKKSNEKVNIINQVSSSNLDADVKNAVISGMIDPDPKGDEYGLMDKIFGKKHPHIYVTLIICLMLTIVGIVCSIVFKENIEFVKYMWGILIPAVTGGVGYMFGAKKND